MPLFSISRNDPSKNLLGNPALRVITPKALGFESQISKKKEGVKMRKYKQVKEKKVTYSLDEWAIIEQRAAKLAMKTGTYIKRISVDGQINHYSVGDITTVMNALRIIGVNINQISKKANETHSIYVEDIGKLRKEVDALSRTLSQLAFTEQLNAA